MVRLEYKSLVTKEIIDYYLSNKIKDDEKQKKDLISTISKFDIRISTKPVIKGEEFYYKIWILRRGTKKKSHIKQYYPLELLKKKTNVPLTLAEIFGMVRLTADVPDDFEEYCEKWFRDPSDRICRIDYLADLKRAKRFKRFITKDEIRFIPFLPCDDDADENIENDKTDDFFDLNNESFLKEFGFSIVYLNDKREYDKLAELKSTLEYNLKIVESYGYDPYTGDVNEKKFPITKEDKQMKNIAKDFDNYFRALEEYNDYLKVLIKKYDIKPTGNVVKRLAFNIHNDDDDDNDDNDSNPEQQHFKFLTAVIDFKDFFF